MSESHSSGPANQSTLIDDCGRGETGVWTQFFEIYAPIVYRYARYAGLSDNDAEEVVATVMGDFVRALPGFTYDRSVGKFRHYLKKVASHEILALRQRRRRQMVDLDAIAEVPGETELPEEGWSVLERQERLRVCFETLRSSGRISPRDWLAFERYALQEKPAERVARELGISRSRLFAIKHETIQKLRRLWTELDAILGEV